MKHHPNPNIDARARKLETWLLAMVRTFRVTLHDIELVEDATDPQRVKYRIQIKNKCPEYPGYDG